MMIIGRTWIKMMDKKKQKQYLKRLDFDKTVKHHEFIVDQKND